jgi:adenylate kinase family enzyme
LKVAITGASGNGKTTLAQRLAERAGLRFVEIDALNHIGPKWTEATPEELRAKVAAAIADDGWVTDATYRNKLGDLIYNSAETIVWLDLPLRVWLPRLLRRTARRMGGRETLWNGNRETLAGAFWGRESLFAYALRMHFRRRREWPAELAGHPVVRLRTPAEVERFLESVRRPPARPSAPAAP